MLKYFARVMKLCFYITPHLYENINRKNFIEFWNGHHEVWWFNTCLIVGFCQAAVVWKVDNTIHVTDQYLVDSMDCLWIAIYPVDKNYLAFEQQGPEGYVHHVHSLLVWYHKIYLVHTQAYIRQLTGNRSLPWYILSKMKNFHKKITITCFC